MNDQVFPSRNSLWDVHNHLLIPGCLALAEVENTGFTVDKSRLAKMDSRYTEKLRGLEDNIRSYPEVTEIEKRVQKRFNFNSHDQVREMLYEQFNLDSDGIPKTGVKQKLSTSKEALAILKGQHAVIDVLQEHRKYATLYKMFVKAMPQHIMPDGRVHCGYQPTTVTGRLRCSDPNLQQVPKNLDPDELGFDFDPELNIKELYVPFDSKYGLLQADYSQIELRILALYSLDGVLIGIFQSGKDIHIATGQEMADIKEPGIIVDKKSKWRKAAKCFHPDTEVLTKSGWKAMRHLGADEEIIQASPQNKQGGVILEWTKPTHLELRPNHCDTLVKSYCEGMDLDTTPDHRMLYETASGCFRICEPKDLATKARYVYNAGNLCQSNGLELDPIMLKLAVATQADGSIYKYKRGNVHIKFGFTKQRKIERMRTLLAGLPYTETIQGVKNPCTCFSLSGELAFELANMLDFDKTLPWSWLNLNQEQRTLVLSEAEHWDGCRSTQPNGSSWKSYSYCSYKPKNIDVLQAMAAITGFKSRTVGDHITISPKSRTQGAGIVCTEYNYDGDVAVISVPSTFVLVRNGGVTSITGQCINFGIIYGKGDDSLAAELGTSLAEAQAFRKIYFTRMPFVESFISEVEDYCRENKEVMTMFGNKRRLLSVDSPNKWTRLEALRQAVNMPIQGTAALYTLASIIEINNAFRRYNFKSRIVATVHDSIVTSYYKPELHAVAEIMTTIMEKPSNRLIYWDNPVPLVADLEYSEDSWATIKEYRA
jgi:DNA polymerase I-like protein with 3'-5' exonuclease and polymerase domains